MVSVHTSLCYEGAWKRAEDMVWFGLTRCRTNRQEFILTDERARMTA